MIDLIEILQILLKYGNRDYPFCCEHDTLYIHCAVKDINEVKNEDIKRLEELGVFWDNDLNNCFISHRFGSC